MPHTRVPVENVCVLSDTESHVDELAFKVDGSERSSSPKSDGSISEISDASDACSSLEFSDISEGSPQIDIFIDEFDSLKVTDEQQAEELARQGADMRHVLCTSWKLQSKHSPSKKFASKAASMIRAPPGQALRDMAEAQKKSIVEHERCSRQLFGGRRHGSAESTGFQLSFGVPADDTQILVSYADGSNSLTLAEEPLCLHNITVSCAVDSCHVFIQQMKNPTYEGLLPLELAIAEAFEEEAPPQLLRPIANGSLLAVNTDDKWYRCQVVGYNSHTDSCDIKFVDHGGYTTVQVSELRPLRSDFVKLPFQAIEVYVAHINPASDEIIIDIASDLLFRNDISIQLLGFAEDGIPIVQAYFYHEDYINLFTQDILDDCYDVFLKAHPDYESVPTKAMVCIADDVSSVDELEEVSSEEAYASSVDESEEFSSEVAYSTDEGVYSPEESEEFASPEDFNQCQSDDDSTGKASPLLEVPAPNSQVTWVPVTTPAAVLCCDPNTGLYYYMPVVAAPACYATPEIPILYQQQQPPVDAEVFTDQHLSLQQSQEEIVQPSEEPVDPEFIKPFEEWSQEDYERYYNSI